MTFSSKRSIGEASVCANHPTKQIYISETNAKKLAALVSKELNWPLYKIKYTGRITRGRNATVWPTEKRMKVHKSGERVSTILHELAHEKGCHHDRVFKYTHVKLLKLWEEKWQQILYPPSNPNHNFSMIKEIDPTQINTNITVQKEEPIKTPDNTLNLIKEVIKEIVEDELTNVTPAYIGKKLVEYKINNLENINKIRGILTTFYGITIK